MIDGVVTDDGSPVVMVRIHNQDWPAVIDTAFNGDLELPESVRPLVNARPNGQVVSLLAAGQTIVEEQFTVDFPFDGLVVTAQATFVEGDTILIGTHLLRPYHLDVRFPYQTVNLERVA